MSRRMKLPTREMGEIQLVSLWSKDSQWEPEWEPLRGTPIGSLFSQVQQSDLDHALHGLSRPLVTALGLPPEGCLRKLPIAHRSCAKRLQCPLYQVQYCHPLSTKMPWCFEPMGLFGEEAVMATKAIELWREGVYVVVVIQEVHRGY